MPSATDRQVLKLLPGGAPRGNERYAPFAVLRVVRPLADLGEARPGDTVILDPSYPTPVVLNRALPANYARLWADLQAGNLEAMNLGAEALVAALAEEAATRAPGQPAPFRLRLETPAPRRRGARKGGPCA